MRIAFNSAGAPRSTSRVPSECSLRNFGYIPIAGLGGCVIKRRSAPFELFRARRHKPSRSRILHVVAASGVPQMRAALEARLHTHN